MSPDHSLTISAPTQRVSPLDNLLTIQSSSSPSSFFIDSIPGLAILSSYFSSSTSTPSVEEIITSLDEAQGTFSFSNGFLTSDLATPYGNLQGTFDLVSLATDFNALLSDATGTLDLANGSASGDLAFDDEFYSGSFEFANLIGDFVATFVDDFAGTVPFADGQILIDIPTPFGSVEGTLGFATGQLVSDLDTPFGELDFSIDFPDDAQFDLPIGNSQAVLNLAAGQIELDLFPALSGPEVAVPLSALSGNITFDNGLANLTVDTVFGSFSTEFNLAAEVDETLTEFLNEATGTLTIANGQLGADLSTSLGSFTGILDASKYIADWIETLPQYAGTLTLDNGEVIADLTTPSGEVDGTLNYGQYLDDIVAFLDAIAVT